MKLLRQMAKELGVSHSYLSKIKHGKRPASSRIEVSLHKVVSNSHKLVSNNTGLEDRKLCYNRHGAELCSGSTGDFGSSSPGSNPGSAANK